MTAAIREITGEVAAADGGSATGHGNEHGASLHNLSDHGGHDGAEKAGSDTGVTEDAFAISTRELLAGEEDFSDADIADILELEFTESSFWQNLRSMEKKAGIVAPDGMTVEGDAAVGGQDAYLEIVWLGDKGAGESDDDTPSGEVATTDAGPNLAQAIESSPEKSGVQGVPGATMQAFREREDAKAAEEARLASMTEGARRRLKRRAARREGLANMPRRERFNRRVVRPLGAIAVAAAAYKFGVHEMLSIPNPFSNPSLASVLGVPAPEAAEAITSAADLGDAVEGAGIDITVDPFNSTIEPPAELPDSIFTPLEPAAELPESTFTPSEPAAELPESTLTPSDPSVTDTTTETLANAGDLSPALLDLAETGAMDVSPGDSITGFMSEQSGVTDANTLKAEFDAWVADNQKGIQELIDDGSLYEIPDSGGQLGISPLSGRLDLGTTGQDLANRIASLYSAGEDLAPTFAN